MKNNANHSVIFFSVYTNVYRNLLKPDKYKDIIVKQLFSFVEENGITLNAFVVMPSHFYIMWQVIDSDGSDILFNSLLKKITREIIYDLEKNHPVVLLCPQKGKQDINTHFWKFQIDELLFHNDNSYYQKLDYIHNNPVRKGLCEKAEEYRHSSAWYGKSVKTGHDGIFDLNIYK